MIFTKTCKYCHGTGDWRGEAGKKKPDYRSDKNRCLHCNGQGFTTKEYRLCKYCKEPIENGYACESCLREFEKAESQEGME